MLLTSPSPASPGDRPEYTYRTGVSEVRLTFSATDQNDHGVATLQATDFAIVDKGVIVRDYQSFSRTDYTKLQIVILLDSSESVSRKFRREITDATELLSQTSGVPEENISLLSFKNAKPLVICAGNCRATHAEDHLPSTQASGVTPLYDSVTFASEFLADRGDAQTEKALILFSDGQDTVSLRSLNDALDAASRNDVHIYSIDVGRGALPGSSILQALTHATGGRYFSASTGARQALDLLLEGFRASYTVTYRLPTHIRGFHEIRILPTHNLNLQFRSRSGYYFPDYIR
jgi:VWFA-related protein